jgi:hypothetical protein
MNKIKLIIILSILFLLTSCGPTTKRHITFEKSSIKKVMKGMTTYEIKKIFGIPDVIYECDMGENTDNTWKGLVYEYFMGLDSTYKFVTKYKTNSFIFWTGNDPPTLYYWHIEYTSDK